jgi:hypothetical protein
MARKECKECGGIMDATRDVDSAPVWECRCCWRVFPRIVRVSAKRAARNAGFDRLVAELLSNQ